MLYGLMVLSMTVQVVSPIQFSESVYSTYKLIEDAVLSDPKLIFKLRQGFFPVISERDWQVDGVQVVPIKLCVTFNPTNATNFCGTNSSCHTVNASTTFCRQFRWTNSYLLNLIPGELLLAIDPIVFMLTYSEIVRSTHRRARLIHLTALVNSSCVPLYDEFLSASALFLSWV